METDKLTYRIDGDRIEFFFQGVLIHSGLSKESYMIYCIRHLRRMLGSGEFGDGTFAIAKKLWEERSPR